MESVVGSVKHLKSADEVAVYADDYVLIRSEI